MLKKVVSMSSTLHCANNSTMQCSSLYRWENYHWLWRRLWWRKWQWRVNVQIRQMSISVYLSLLSELLSVYLPNSSEWVNEGVISETAKVCVDLLQFTGLLLHRTVSWLWPSHSRSRDHAYTWDRQKKRKGCTQIWALVLVDLRYVISANEMLSDWSWAACRFYFF